jgi:benzaldehyde dehydrogenase (NAD)
MPIIEPATGAELARAGLGDAEDVARAATTATAAQKAWAATNFEERAAVLRRAGDLILKHANEIQRWVSREDRRHRWPGRLRGRRRLTGVL